VGLRPLRTIITIIAALTVVSCGNDVQKELGNPLRPIPNFRGVDQYGEAFDASALRGSWWIGSFFFTTCETVCPMLNTEVGRLHRTYSDVVTFVSITTDPTTDTPEVMKAYGDGYGAKRGSWHFVRMPDDSMRSTISTGFGLIRPDEPDMHSTRLVLVDDNMNVRAYFDASDSGEVARLEHILGGLR